MIGVVRFLWLVDNLARREREEVSVLVTPSAGKCRSCRMCLLLLDLFLRGTAGLLATVVVFFVLLALLGFLSFVGFAEGENFLDEALDLELVLRSVVHVLGEWQEPVLELNGLVDDIIGQFEFSVELIFGCCHQLGQHYSLQLLQSASLLIFGRESIQPSERSSQRRIEVVLHAIVRSALKSLGDGCPSIPVLIVGIKENLFFLRSPLCVLDAGIKLVVPSLSALLAGPSCDSKESFHGCRDIIPFLDLFDLDNFS